MEIKASLLSRQDRCQELIVQQSERNRFSTKGYTARKWILPLFVAAYAVVAHWGWETSPRREFFPVFNWSPFTHVYWTHTLPELHVVSIGDKRFAKPINFWELDSHFESARRRSIVLTKTLGRLTAAAERGDTAEVERLRRVIEARHLSGHGEVEYEVRTVSFLPTERWKNKDSILDQKVVGRFKLEATQ
jgi:hypothetical protein